MTWSKTTLPYLLGWSFVYIACCIKHNSKQGFLTEYQFALGHSIILVIISFMSLYIDNEEVFSEAIPLDFSLGFFLVELFDCIIRRDLTFTIHAVISLLLNYMTSRPTHFALRSGSKGSLCEISTPLYYLWKKTKRKRHFQYFGLVFFLCRLVWVPLFVYKTLQVCGFDDVVVWASIAFYILQCCFFVKFLTMLLNYQDPNEVKDEAVELKGRSKTKSE